MLLNTATEGDGFLVVVLSLIKKMAKEQLYKIVDVVFLYYFKPIKTEKLNLIFLSLSKTKSHKILKELG